MSTKCHYSEKDSSKSSKSSYDPSDNVFII